MLLARFQENSSVVEYPKSCPLSSVACRIAFSRTNPGVIMTDETAGNRRDGAAVGLSLECLLALAAPLTWQASSPVCVPGLLMTGTGFLPHSRLSP